MPRIAAKMGSYMEEETKETKVYNLVIELQQTKKEKSISTKVFNEEIARINAEIADLLEDDEEEKE